MTKSITARLSGLLAALASIAVMGCGDGGPVDSGSSIDLTSLSPTYVEQYFGPLEVRATGSGFREGATVLVDGEPRTTTWQSPTRLTAALTPGDLEVRRTASVAVRNPGPEGGTSEALDLEVRTPSDSFPIVTNLAPDHTIRGSGDMTLLVEGRGFFPGALVGLDGVQMPSSRQSAMLIQVQLDSAFLMLPTSRSVHVINPTPLGHASQPTYFEIRNPVPTIDSIRPATILAGQPAPTISIMGTGFFAGTSYSDPTTVQVDGEDRAASWVSHGVLDVGLTATDVAAGDTLLITVVNPGPGGGSSAPDSVFVVVGPPSLEALPVRGGRAGGNGFDVMVHGSGFTPASEVLWNGAARGTQFLSGARLRATILPADVAAPGDVDISVRTPGIGTSDALTFTLRTPPAATVTAADTVLLQGRDMVYDPGTAALYVSVPSGAPAWSNSLAVVDPVAASVTGGIAVGSDPARVARTQDGQYLYVGLDGASAVRRVTLASGTPGPQWSLPSGQVAGDLETAPGQPGTVAVSRHNPGYSPPLAGVTIYDDGVARSVSSPGHTGGARIEFLDSPTILYGYNNAHTGFEFFTIEISDDGARHLYEDGGLISGFYDDIVGAGGRIYSTGGEIIDVALRTRIATLATSGTGAIAPDPATGRAFAPSDQGIAVYDLNTFQRVDTIPVTVSGAIRMVRWGDDGLAILTTDALVLVRSPILAP